MTAKNLRRLNGRCLQHRRNDQKMRKCGIVVRKLLRRLTLPEWHRVLDTNLTAAFLLARAAEKPLREARGAIVTVASTRALMSEPNTESYSASKGGLLALTHALAISLAPTCASIASAPAGSKLRIIPRYGARITSSIPPAASAGRKISPNL